jgi:signal transduction histidine kinase
LRPRLRVKYSLVLAGLVAACLLAQGLIEMGFGWRDALRDSRDAQHRVARDIAGALRIALGTIEQQLGLVALLPWDREGWLGMQRRREEFHRLLLLVPALDEIRLVGPDQQILVRVSRRDVDFVFDGEVATSSNPPGPFVLKKSYSDLQYERGYEPFIGVTLTVPDRLGARVEAGISMRALARELRDVLSPQDMTAYVVNSARQLVLHADTARILDPILLPAAVDVAFDGTQRGLDGQPVIAVAESVPAMPWTVVVEQPRDRAWAPVREALGRTAAVTVLGALLAIAASSLLARRMARPIAALHDGAVRLGEGDLGVRIHIHTHDELEDLASQFNRMAASLQASYADLEDKVTARTLALQRATRHKSEFLANMSHELRTPLNAILGFADVLREGMAGPLNDDQREYIADIHASGLHLLALINDVLDLSKIEAGQLELERSDFSVPDTVASAVALVRQRALQKNLALQVDVAPALGLWHADERRFKQVLLNLLSNAVKFTPDGGRVTVQAGLSEDPAQGLWLSVQDTGIGIAPADHEAVFQEFRQVGADPAGRAEGTGLGLALARRLVEQHGGCITLHSEPGAGSCFRFNIPGAAA